MEAGAFDAVLSNHWAEGGQGAADLGRAVEKACKENDEANFKFLYDLDKGIKEKIETISKISVSFDNLFSSTKTIF